MIMSKDAALHLAAEAEAALVLCALYLVASTPARVSTVRIHLRIVSLDTALCGFI